MSVRLLVLLVLLVVAPQAHSAPARETASLYPGFGFRTTGGLGRPVFPVTSLADSGPGSLRDALRKAARGGGTIRFVVGGEIWLASGLDVPGQTTIDGSSAPPPGITLRGEHSGASGAVKIANGNVILRDLRIRNAMNDGVHIAPRRGHAITNIVVDHCSVTNSSDGGIDITGWNSLPVTDVTIISNYIAGSGGSCAKGMCGGGSLAKYGADRVSYYYNFWDKNLRRTPTVSGDCVTDIRYNVIRSPVQGGIQIRDGARANVVGNTLEGSNATVAFSIYGGHAHLEGVPRHLSDVSDLPQATPVPHPPPAKTPTTVIRDAGALPRAAADSYCIDIATTFDQVKKPPALDTGAAHIAAGPR